MVYWSKSIFMNRRPNCLCHICGKSIYRRPASLRSGNVYCSSTCFGINQQHPKTCPVCNKQYVGHKKTCSRACANKSRTGIQYTRQGIFDKAYQGRFLKEEVATLRGGICEKCSESNYAILQVHHKTERYRGGTDDLSSLELLCPNCHATHHLGRSLWTHS